MALVSFAETATLVTTLDVGSSLATSIQNADVTALVTGGSSIVTELMGPPGVRGEAGARGATGSRGATGATGPQGPAGASADPTVVNNLSTRVDALTTNIRDIINLAPETLNAFSEVASALNNDPQFAQTMTTALGNRVRFDAAQALDSTQRNIVRSNIDAASVSDVTGKLSKESYVRSLQVVVSGKPAANALLGGGITPQSGTIDTAASVFAVDIAPTLDAIFSLRINGTQRGTVTFPAGQTVGTLALTGAALVVGDRIAFYAGAADATLAGVIGSLVVRL
jgi:hypothetical protein